MCDPVSLTAAAAVVGGTMLKANESASNSAAAVNAKNTGTANMIQQEQNLQKQSSGIFDQTIQPYQDNAPAQNLQAAQGANTSAISANGPTATQLAGGATTGNAPKVVQDSENSTIASRLSKLKSNDAALGTLSGYDSVNQNNARGQSIAKSKIGTIGDFANQDASTGTALTNEAVANSQKAPSPFGDLLQGAGQIGLMAGSGGLSGLFGGTTAAGTNGAVANLGQFGSVSGATPAFRTAGLFY